MPRVVDHAGRRQDLAAALWRVVRDGGIQQVSVRSVAAAAGTSPSALRHYFRTQDELLGFALQAMVARVRDRVLPMLPELHGRDGALRLIEELLPMDRQRRDEVAVYLAFLGRSVADPGLTAIRDDAEAQSRTAVVRAVELLAAGGGLGPGRDAGAEADRLYPLVDGLALHGALWPDRYPPAHLHAVLETHLAELATAVTGPGPRPAR
jgi:AcrR family transcriptional regulator